MTTAFTPVAAGHVVYFRDTGLIVATGDTREAAYASAVSTLASVGVTVTDADDLDGLDPVTTTLRSDLDDLPCSIAMFEASGDESWDVNDGIAVTRAEVEDHYADQEDAA